MGEVLLLVLGLGAGMLLGRKLFPVRIIASIQNGDFFSPPDSGNFGWNITPSAGGAPQGTEPPRRKETEQGGFTGLWIRIGADGPGGRPGAEGSTLSQTFDCGQHRTAHFCTVTFYARLNLRDGEQARVRMSVPGKPPKELFIPDTGSANPVLFRISYPGCAGNVTLAFDVTRGQTGHIQSTLDIHGVSSDCTMESNTNMRAAGQLRNAAGEPVAPGS